MKERLLNVELRTEYGKNECNRLRAKGLIPAIIYSHGTSESIQVPVKNFTNIFKGHISESVLIDINITNKPEDKEHKAFVKDYLVDPVSNAVQHIDFYKVTADEKIRTSVQVDITGAPKGVKAGGVLEIFERELEIECLPKDMPERISIDVSNLEIGDSFRIGDLNMGESVRFLESSERPIASVVIPHVKEEEVVTEEAVEGEGAEAAKAEGEGEEKAAE
jgi:large subunit ribosomal protein L25